MTLIAAKVHRTSDITGITWPKSPIDWQVAEFDTHGFWSAGAPSRLTIPSGVIYARVFAAISFENVANQGSVYVTIQKNGSGVSTGRMGHRANSSGGFSNNTQFCETPWLAVTVGDYFSCYTNVNMSTQDQILAAITTFFQIEART